MKRPFKGEKMIASTPPRPVPVYTGSIWACPECRNPWHTCECAAPCRAPSASTPTTRGYRALVSR
jgi:hypothetical protein